MMLGLTAPTSGRVAVNGLDPARDPLGVKRNVGYLPDDVGFYDELTGRENLRYTGRLNHLPRKALELRMDEVLAEVGLTTAADRKVRTFSRGMRQRLGLADALMKDPPVLVLDEPTVNIDPEGVRDILALVARLRDERGTTVLLSSHLLHQVEQVCDRIGIFLAGQLVTIGSVRDLIASLDHDWTIEVEIAERHVDLTPTLRGVPGVLGVERDGATWLIEARGDIRAEIATAVASSNAHLVQLQRRGADLDAIYHQYFTSGEPQLEPAGASA